MAILSKEQAKQKVKDPKNKKDLIEAREKKIRNRLHAQADVLTPGFNPLHKPHHQNFLDWVKLLLEDNESFKKFAQLYNPPVPTNELAETIFSEHSRIFKAEDRNIDFSFRTPELTEDAKAYLESIGDQFFWKNEGFERYKNSIDDIIVVDIMDDPNEVKPFYYFVKVEDIIDIENTKVTYDPGDNDEMYLFKTEYIAFNRGEKVIVIDDESYKIFERRENDEIVFIEEHLHYLGYCPARSFWSTPLNSDSRILMKNQFINSLSELDWLLFFEYSKKYLDLYAPFPIYAVYRARCNYKDLDTGNPCINGVITYTVGRGDRAETHTKKCPKCSTGVKIGAGQVLEFGAPQDKDDPDLLRNPVKIIPAEKASLEYIQGEIQRLELEIYQNNVGAEDEGDAPAKNEMQIQKGLESKVSILREIAKNFEIVQTWTYETLFRLRYGVDVEYMINVNYGENFFKPSKDKLIAEIKEAKEAGFASYEIHGKKMQFYEKLYSNNPRKMNRIKILNELDPFPDRDVNEVLEWKQKGAIISQKDLLTKMYFTNLVQRFEREQTSVEVFASKLDFGQRVSLIRGILDKYIADMMPQTNPKEGVDPEGLEREDIEAEARQG